MKSLKIKFNFFRSVENYVLKFFSFENFLRDIISYKSTNKGLFQLQLKLCVRRYPQIGPYTGRYSKPTPPNRLLLTESCTNLTVLLVCSFQIITCAQPSNPLCAAFESLERSPRTSCVQLSNLLCAALESAVDDRAPINAEDRSAALAVPLTSSSETLTCHFGIS